MQIAKLRTVQPHGNGEYTVRKADGNSCCSGEHHCVECKAAVRQHLQKTTVPAPPSMAALIRKQRGLPEPKTVEITFASSGVPRPPVLRDLVLQMRGELR